MTLQAAVNFREYFRCYVIGQEQVRIMPYDPRRPHAERYVQDPPPYDPALHRSGAARRAHVCRALGYDLNTVEFAVEDGVPYAIDFMNPAPDAELRSIGPANFAWIVDAVADMARARRRWRRRRRRRMQAGDAAVRDALLHDRHRRGIPDGRSAGRTTCARTSPPRSSQEGKRRMNEKVKAEMHQSVIEVGTGVCQNIKEADEDLLRSAAADDRASRRRTACVSSPARTHPFADWRAQDIYPDERYLQVVEDMQIVARANLIFGLHVHVGIEDRETLIHLMNQMRYFLPHLLALSTNSPFWIGMNTGLKSLPLQGLRPVPAHEHPRHVHLLGGLRELRQSARPHQLHRQRQEDLVGHPAASRSSPRSKSGSATSRCASRKRWRWRRLIQATAVKLYRLHEQNQSWRQYSRALLMENKWRAARYGIHGSLIDFGHEREVDERALDPRVPRVGGRRAWMNWAVAGGRWSTCAGFSTTARAPTASWPAWEASGRDLPGRSSS